jgi:hypothetical protein
MAEQVGAGDIRPGTDAVGGPVGGRPPAPRILPWLVLYTIGRLAILAALVLILWTAGLGREPGLLFGLLLSMPVSYLLLRPSRERLNEALSARSEARRAAKADLRARLSGSE